MELDHRFKPEAITPEKIDTWAEVFEGRVWPNEARRAVIEHYRDGGSFQLMPNDIVEYCDAQPLWSSREHVEEWLHETLRDHPFTPGFENASGIKAPSLENIPFDEVPTWEAQKAWARARIEPWLRENWEAIVSGILERKYTGATK